MKRLILSVAAMAAVAGPMLTAAPAAQAQSWDRQERHAEQRDDRWDRREESWDRREDRWDRREDRWDGREDRWDHRYDRRDHRFDHRHSHPHRGQAWDHRRYNGYYYQNRWSYGPPPAVYFSHPQYRPGYVAWRRGAVLPHHYRGYVIHDYHRYRLRPPPRGHAWHQVGNDYLLAAIATGIIFEIISNR